jgi:hypothetical protein
VLANMRHMLDVSAPLYVRPKPIRSVATRLLEMAA